MKQLILVSLCIMLFAGIKSSNAQEPGKIPVEVSQYGEDPVGNQLAYEVKDKIRRSSRYFIEVGSEPHLMIHLTTIDPSQGLTNPTGVEATGLRTSYSAVLTFRSDEPMPLRSTATVPHSTYDTVYAPPFYIDDLEGICGSSQVEAAAAQLIAAFDKDVDDLEQYPFFKALTMTPKPNSTH
jgi:hypothetical protein